MNAAVESSVESSMELTPQENETIERTMGRVAAVFWGGLITAAGIELPVIVRALQTGDEPIGDSVSHWMIKLGVMTCVLVPLGYLSYEWRTRNKDAFGRVPPAVFRKAATFRIICLLVPVLFAQVCVLVTGQLFPFTIFQMLIFLLLFTLWPSDGPMRNAQAH